MSDKYRKSTVGFRKVPPKYRRVGFRKVTPTYRRFQKSAVKVPPVSEKYRKSTVGLAKSTVESTVEVPVVWPKVPSKSKCFAVLYIFTNVWLVSWKAPFGARKVPLVLRKYRLHGRKHTWFARNVIKVPLNLRKYRFFVASTVGSTESAVGCAESTVARPKVQPDR